MKKLIPHLTSPYKRGINGFTLVELIIVITILTILGTISFISFQDYFADSRDANRVTTISNIKQSLDLQKMKTRKYPTPAQAVSYTGGNTEIQQGVINKEILSDMSNDPKDPGSGEYYTYSITENGKYYQLAAQLENEVGYKSFVSKTYADDYATVKVEGNYKFDPSFPSLIIVPSSYTSGSGIFALSVCFVLDGGVNTLTTCNQKKSEMSLKEYDTSLVGYWDMETYYQTSYSGISDVVFLKDLSGNNYDLVGKKSSTLFLTGIINNSGSIFSSGGVNFDRGNYLYSFFSIPQSVSINSRLINLPNAYFYKTNDDINGNLKNGLTISTLISYNKTQSELFYDKMIFSYTRDNYESIDAGDAKKYDMLLHRLLYHSTNTLLQHAYQTYYSPINNYPKNMYYLSGTAIGCSNDGLSMGECSSTINANYGYQNLQANTLNDGLMLLTAIFNFSNRELNYYINGNLIKKIDIHDPSTIKMLEKGFKRGIFGIGGYYNSIYGYILNPPIGTIDDVKIYNRALSDEEIAQQAKIAGF